jgi:hypothetical protein
MIIGWMVCSCVLVASPLLRAQDVPSMRPNQPATGRQIPLKVQLVVSRMQGTKQVSSLPYTLSVVANDNDKTSLRMGVEVPIPQTVFGGAAKGGEVSVPQVSYTYRSMGTNIDCSARTLEDGVFKLDLAVEDASVFVTDKEGPVTTNRTPGLPMPSFRKFASTFNLLLKDGQTAQHTTATDPVSGEVLRIEVTLSVVK